MGRFRPWRRLSSLDSGGPLAALQSHPQIWEFPKCVARTLALPVLHLPHILRIKVQKEGRQGQLEHLLGKVLGNTSPTPDKERLDRFLAICRSWLRPTLRNKFVGCVEIVRIVVQGEQGSGNFRLQ